MAGTRLHRTRTSYVLPSHGPMREEGLCARRPATASVRRRRRWSPRCNPGRREPGLRRTASVLRPLGREKSAKSGETDPRIEVFRVFSRWRPVLDLGATMPRTRPDHPTAADADVRLAAARYVRMTPEQREAAVMAMAALLAHARRRRPVLEGGRGDDVCLSADPTTDDSKGAAA